MPSNYVKKTNRSTRSPEDVLEKAAKLVTEEGLSYRKAADLFGIDKMTLSRFIKKKRLNPESAVGYNSTSIKKRIFSPEMEEDLAAHITYLAQMYFGLSLEKCKELAYEFALQNNIDLPDSWEENKKAGKQWWMGFKKRRRLSIRAPEPTSIGRAIGFNENACRTYFQNLSDVLDKHQFAADRIFNVDETGVTTVQDPKKVVTPTGMKNVGAITSGERGELVTAVYAICASGYALAPMLIFPRVNYREHFIRGAPPGTVGKATRTGWINEKIFIEFLDYISVLTCSSPTSKILIILDNHESHISLAVIDKARETGIVLLTIPPKTSHKLQPLDKAVFSSFKASYNRAMDNWLRSNPGKRVTIYEIPALVHEAHLSSMVPRNILSGFSSTGNWPYNPDVFTSADFAPAAVTDNDFIPDSANNPNTSHLVSQLLQDKLPAEQPGSSGLLVMEGSAPNVASNIELSSLSSPVAGSYISPASIMPLPKATTRKKTGRRKGQTRVYTNTPVRNEIAERTKEKNAKKSKKAAPKKVKKRLFPRKKRATKQIEAPSSSSDEMEIPCDDESDSDILNETVVASVGDYVIVLVSGKSRALKYIARIDELEDNEFEGVFLQKVNSKIVPGENAEAPTFVINEQDGASFAPDDVVLKLPAPVVVGGSARKSGHLRFNFDFSKVDLA